MTTGRTGSDYLAGCLDGVKNVMTFAGLFDHLVFFNNSKQTIKRETLINKFLKKYNFLFNHNKIENLKLNLNSNKFKRLFIKNSPNELNQREFLISLYETYNLLLKRKISESSVIVHHTHGRANTNNFLKYFPNAKLFITIRDPRANLKSGLLNWFNYDSRSRHMQHIYIYLRRIRDDLNYAISLKNKKIFIKLEESNKKKTKSKIINFLGVKYDRNIMISTFANIPWQGDRLSKHKNNNGKFNKSVIYNGWKKYFSKEDIKILNFLYFNYNGFYKISNLSILGRFKSFFKVITPFTFEHTAFRNHKNIFSKKYMFNIIFYLKRVIYIQLLILGIDIFKV